MGGPPHDRIVSETFQYWILLPGLLVFLAIISTFQIILLYYFVNCRLSYLPIATKAKVQVSKEQKGEEKELTFRS